MAKVMQTPINLIGDGKFIAQMDFLRPGCDDARKQIYEKNAPLFLWLER